MRAAFFLVMMFFCKSTLSAILIEPVGGYSTGKFVLSEDVDMKGTSFGGRAGYGGHNFQIAYDFLKSKFNVDDFDHDLETTEHGLFFGFRFWHMRMFASYMMSAKGTIGTSKLKGGDGPKVGLNFYLFRNLSIEASWREIDYDEVDGDTAQDYGYKAYFVGLSIPIEFFGKKSKR